MLVNFIKSGNIIDTKNTDNEVAVQVYSGGPYTTPTIDPRVSGANRFYDGKITAGSMLGHIAGAGRAQLAWKSPSNATVGLWEMDDETAVQTAITTIQTAINASTGSIDLYSNGTTSS
jgi:hypothetical protein